MTPFQRRPQVEIFSILFGIVYLTCFYMDWSPFRYYPETRRFHLRMTPADGPAILWYGWLAAAAVVSAAVALAVPRSLAERMRPEWAWALPAIIVILVFVYESRWFV